MWQILHVNHDSLAIIINSYKWNRETKNIYYRNIQKKRMFLLHEKIKNIHFFCIFYHVAP